MQAIGHGFKFHILHQSAQFAEMRVGAQRSSSEAGHLYSSLAQSVERMTVNHDVAGSSPAGGAIWSVGQAAKTPPFHGSNTGSIPVPITICFRSSVGRARHW